MNQNIFDSIIIGGGPAGLAVAHSFEQAGVNYCVYEKGPIAWHISQYPTFMRFFSTNENLEIAGFPLGITEEKPSRQEYLHYLTNFVQYHGLNVETYAPVTGVERGDDGVYRVEVSRAGREPEIVLARSVVVAVGAWEAPRKLDVPGADLPKVRYRYTESHDFIGKKVLVVGGRNSAIETALQLWRAGAEVSLSYRQNEFTGRGVKYWLKPDIDNRLKNGEIAGYLGTNISRVDWDQVELKTNDGKTITIENDFVLAMLGYDPPVEFLSRLGIQLERETNRPLHDPETLEAEGLPGMFIAGVITYGNISGHVFIENSRHHGELILPRLKEILEQVPAGK